MGRHVGHTLNLPQIVFRLPHEGVVLQGDHKAVPQGVGLQSGKGFGIVLFLHEVLQGFFPGNKLGVMNVSDHIDLRPDALGLILRIGLVNIDDHFILLFQLRHHNAEIVQNQTEAAHDDQAGNGDADCREGHEAVEENTPDAFADQITKFIPLHTYSTRPFRR